MLKVDGGYIHPAIEWLPPGRKRERMGMFQFLWCIFLLLLTFAMPVEGVAQGSQKPPRNIILIGWDGAQRNHVKECLGRDELPNLKQLSLLSNM